VTEFKSQRLKVAIKGLVKKKGLTYKDIAKLLDCSTPTVKRILGREELSLNRLLELCEILDVSLAELEELSKEESLQKEEFSPEQQKFLVQNRSYFAYLMELFDGKNPQEIQKNHGLRPLSTQRYLLGLEKQDLIKVSGSLKVKPNFKSVPHLGQGKLAELYTQSFLKTCAQFFIDLLSEVFYSKVNKENAPKIHSSLSILKLSESSHKQWSDELAQMLKNIEKISKFEENSKDPSELKTTVILHCHASTSPDHPKLKSIRNIFGPIPDL